MPSKNPAQRFRDILDNIARIERFTHGCDLHSFTADEKLIFSVKHALLIISEAAIKLDILAEDLCPEIAWKQIRGLGNKLRHEYDAIDVVRIWFLIEKDLQPLKQAALGALKNFD